MNMHTETMKKKIPRLLYGWDGRNFILGEAVIKENFLKNAKIQKT